MPKFEPTIVKPVPTPAARESEKRDIALAALALARRAEQAGLGITAYMLELAALEAGVDIAIRRSGQAEADP